MTTKQSIRTTIQRMKADTLTPVSIFKRLQGRHKFLLESSAKYEDAGRYSFIGVNPRKTYYGDDEILHDVLHDTEQRYTYEGPLLRSLQQVMPRVSSATEFPFIGGAVGYIRYGVGTEHLEQENMPAVQFHIYDTLVIFDHIQNDLTIVHTNIDAEHQKTDIGSVLQQLQTVPSSEENSFLMEALQYELQSGTEQQTAQATFTGDAFELYRKLRILLPGAYLYYMEFDGHSIIGSSKDSFIAVQQDTLQAYAENFEHQTRTVQALQKVATDITGVDCIQATLQPGLHSLQALGALLPPVQVPSSLANNPKKAFGSVVGYIGFNGQIDFTLANQVLVIEDDKLYASASGSNYTSLINILTKLTGGTR
ncbi:MAG: metal ABC transporter ATP-binding protein [Lysinibacillus sp.]